MTNKNNSGGSTDEVRLVERELDEAWGQFEKDLAGYLATMDAGNECDYLWIELAGRDPEDDAGRSPYAQFVGLGDGRMLRAEVSGDSYLLPQYRLGAAGDEFFAVRGWRGNDAMGDEEERNWLTERPAAEAAAIAHDVVTVMRVHFGIAHPHLLTYTAWGPAAMDVDRLGLCATHNVPADEPAAPAAAEVEQRVRQELALEPADRDDLMRFVRAVLRLKYDAEPTVDDDGDFVLRHMDQPVWVRVGHDQPAVEVVARVAHDVHSRRATAVETGLLNRDHAWVRWELRERTVWQRVVLPGLPFVPRHFEVMLDLFFDAMTTTRDDLAYRLGARVG